jgi:hypothetical protein
LQKQAARLAKHASSANFLLCLILNREDGVDMFPQTLGCHQTTRCYNPEAGNAHCLCRDNLKFKTIFKYFKVSRLENFSGEDFQRTTKNEYPAPSRGKFVTLSEK